MGGDDARDGKLPAALLVPHPSRCDPQRGDHAEILARHAAAIAAECDAYVDPATGYQVWTAQYLWDRGYCCDTGCRHCPYLRRE